MNWILQMLLFVAILAVLKLAGVPISIVGSVLLTIVLSAVMMMFQRQRYRT